MKLDSKKIIERLKNEIELEQDNTEEGLIIAISIIKNMAKEFKEEFLNPKFIAYTDKDIEKVCFSCKKNIKTGKYILCPCGTAFCNLDCFERYEKKIWEEYGKTLFFWQKR